MQKTRIYMVRHGQSQANERDVFLGHTDLDLTKKGCEQALATAKYLSQIPVDRLYSSDLKRAYHTAEATAELLHLPIEKREALREIFCGEWENQPFAKLETEYKESYGVWLQNIDEAHPEQGESVLQLKARIVASVENIAKENEGKTVFIFSHATPIRCFGAYCKGVRVKDLPWVSNASVSYFEYENGLFSLIEYGKDDFLGAAVTALPKNV